MDLVLTAIGQAIDAVRGFVTGASSAVAKQRAVIHEISMSMQAAARESADVDCGPRSLVS
ncbi:hypothetical protein ASF49_17515 [Methylobacterium sp. Leaf104]|uniref:hypothetical protein n=1 Tax=Methylobacterium TaxID=407 RepID=UPI000701D459|nr:MULTISPECIES: hypothetical protein [Methylobacterium]KQP41180.1 hypothetical protein ASF49_17515 [Methylobacterium sp. Leaf104]MCI9879441.1 hypothetical protein [Methylobacterium goesingense]